MHDFSIANLSSLQLKFATHLQFFHFQDITITINNCPGKFSFSGVGKGCKSKLVFMILITGAEALQQLPVLIICGSALWGFGLNWTHHR